MELTEIERKIIECYRNGASVNVVYYTHNSKSLDDAYRNASIYGIKHIKDFTGGPTSFIDFGNEEHEDVKFNTFLGATRD